MTSSNTATRTHQAGFKRVLGSAAVGQFVEWYDFVIYAYSASILATLFFPAENRIASILATFAVYAVGFVMRPVGGLIFGNMGDRFGRKNVLSTVILVMGAATFAIGLLPTHAQIGTTAAVLLVICRLLQGLSAGAETTGSNTLVAEHSPAGKKGLFVSLTYAFANLPAVFASLLILALTSLLGPTIYADWGWRIPFLLGGVFALVGLYIRRQVDESPEFKALKETETRTSSPVVNAVSKNSKAIFLAFVLAALSSLGFYTLTGYFTTYLRESVTLDASWSLASNAIAMLGAFAMMIYAGHLSDRVGRRKILVTGAALSAIVAIPAYMLAASGTAAGAIAGQLLLALALSLFFGPFGVAFLEIFPTATRFTGAALGYNLAYVIFGGTAPYFSTWLVGTTGNLLAPAFYMVAVAGIVAIVAFFMFPAGIERDHKTAEVHSE